MKLRTHRRLAILVSCVVAFGGLAACEGEAPEAARTTETAASVAVSGVTFRTTNGHYLGARNAGGEDLNALATIPDAWESFTVIPVDGTPLESGDLVFVRAGGGQYLQANGGGGGDVNVASRNMLAWETFRIVRVLGDGPIRSRDVVGLQAIVSGKWLSAENGGGGRVFAYGAQLGDWEKLVIEIGEHDAGRPLEPTPVPVPAPESTWKLVWSDEFDGDALDRTKWNVRSMGGAAFNNELQSYADRRENLRVENGHLVIEARRDGYVPPTFERGAPTAQYSSARIDTKAKASFTYGRIEARIQVPPGRGTWPAFWMLGEDIDTVGWPKCGEIDVMEYVGFEHDTAFGTTHTPRNFGANGRGGKKLVPGLSAGYHVFSADWSPSRIDFAVDGNTYFTDTPPEPTREAWPFDRPQFLLLNLAIGGDFGGAKGVDETIFAAPVQMLVDYVRVYEKHDAP